MFCRKGRKKREKSKKEYFVLFAFFASGSTEPSLSLRAIAKQKWYKDVPLTNLRMESREVVILTRLLRYRWQ